MDIDTVSSEERWGRSLLDDEVEKSGERWSKKEGVVFQSQRSRLEESHEVKDKRGKEMKT